LLPPLYILEIHLAYFWIVDGFKSPPK
jgi:hypothetical protein